MVVESTAPGSNASSSSRSCLFRARVANLHDGLGQGVDLGLNVFVRSFSRVGLHHDAPLILQIDARSLLGEVLAETGIAKDHRPRTGTKLFDALTKVLFLLLRPSRSLSDDSGRR